MECHLVLFYSSGGYYTTFGDVQDNGGTVTKHFPKTKLNQKKVMVTVWYSAVGVQLIWRSTVNKSAKCARN